MSGRPETVLPRPEPTAPRGGRAKVTLGVTLPLLALVLVVLGVLATGDRMLEGFGHNPPPADELHIDRVKFLDDRRVAIRVTNPQSEAITPAHITVDAGIINSFASVGGGRTIEPRDTRTLEFEYDWIQDDPYVFTIVSSSGVPTEFEVPAAVPADEFGSEGLRWGAALGIIVGFVPVALGLIWLPALRRLSEAALAGFLAFTGGLLTFLAIDAAAEAFETQTALVPSMGGIGVVAVGVVVSMVGLALVGRALRRGAGAAAARSTGSGALSAGTLAVLVAVGIGIHNMGEGLAIGTSFATGEASLAMSLVIGFLIHNITEGVGIAAPLARTGRRLPITHGIALAALAGLPAVLGIWIGRLDFGPLFATLCFALAAGAAAQVVVEIGRSLRGGSVGFASAWVQGGFALGLAAMWGTGILAG